MLVRVRLFFLFILLSGMFCLTDKPPIAHAQKPTPPPPAPPGRLQVLTVATEPFVMKQGDRFTGFSVELWDALAKRLGYTYDWVELQSVDDLQQLVQSGNADVIVGKVIITAEREKLMDFSVPYFVSGMQVMVGAPQRTFIRAVISTIFRPELLQVLSLGFLTLLVMAHIIWLVERGSNEAIPRAYFRGIWESMWWALSTIATLQYGNYERPPRSMFNRLIAAGMVVLGIILIAEFTAAITADLTIQELGETINGPGDLPGKRIATISQSLAANYLDEQGIQYTGVKTIDEAANLLEQGEVDAVVFDSPALRYYATHHGNGKVKVVGPIFKTVFYGIALSTDSPLRKQVNEGLLSLFEDGTYDQIYQKWFGTVK